MSETAQGGVVVLLGSCRFHPVEQVAGIQPEEYDIAGEQQQEQASEDSNRAVLLFEPDHFLKPAQTGVYIFFLFHSLILGLVMAQK